MIGRRIWVWYYAGGGGGGLGGGYEDICGAIADGVAECGGDLYKLRVGLVQRIEDQRGGWRGRFQALGAYPLPIAYQRGEWRAHFQMLVSEPTLAQVDYQIEPDETGLEGWVWWADGNFGCAPTLRDAMRAAESAIGVG